MRIILIGLCLIVASCTFEDRPAAMNTLEAMGFTNITLHDPELWSGCGQGDNANHPFHATNSAGKRVQGTVCCGGPLSNKQCTVRF